ncbi:MAG: hypothetical protein ACLQT5_15055 [Steroidobacteraceae bacterium]|jgi:hypothetical protein
MAASPQVFELPDHGTLTLLMPDGWAGEITQPRNQSAPTITVGPRSGPKFVIFITAMGPTAAGKMPDESAIRSEVAGAAKSAASQAVESALPLQEIKGVDGRGFYFTATDRAPRPGEAKYLAQGIIRVGEIALAFTVLTNDGQEAVVRSAFDMLRTAVHRPGSAG